LLISLDDRRGFVVNLGIIQECNFKRKCFTIYTPLKDLSKVFNFKFGSTKIDLDGKELGKVSPEEI
jgi:polynucleotide 5'-kinase involved in rRNA processing